MPDASDFFNTQEFNRLIKIRFDVRMKEAVKSLASKSQVNDALDLGDQNRKKLQMFDSSYLLGKSHFEDDGSQNYLFELFDPKFI